MSNDIYILVKVTTRPTIHAGPYGHYMVVKEIIERALEKAANDPKNPKIYENFTIDRKDAATLDFAEEIEKAIDRKFEEKSEELKDKIRDLERDVKRRPLG